ncbi:hypothetical protein ZTR_04681 [Talaromyces verruculosus]|nr:hypothetical protein ZTR_04681 [Talaromyces verruculosus]
MKTSTIATLISLLTSNVLVAKAANCQGSHLAAWGGLPGTPSTTLSQRLATLSPGLPIIMQLQHLTATI